MHAGCLRDRVTIQIRQEDEDSPLGTDVSWVDTQTIWAKVVTLGLSGREKYQQLGHSDAAYKIIFRGTPALSLDRHRFQWKGKQLRPVEPPDVDAINGWTTIVVAEV